MTDARPLFMTKFCWTDDHAPCDAPDACACPCHHWDAYHAHRHHAHE